MNRSPSPRRQAPPSPSLPLPLAVALALTAVTITESQPLHPGEKVNQGGVKDGRETSVVHYAYRPSAPAHRRIKESPLRSDAIFKQDQQSRELSQRHVTKRAKKLKVKEEEIKLKPVIAFDVAEIRERDWCNVVTCHMDTVHAYVWRLQNFVLGEHILTPGADIQAPVKVLHARKTNKNAYKALIAAEYVGVEVNGRMILRWVSQIKPRSFLR